MKKAFLFALLVLAGRLLASDAVLQQQNFIDLTVAQPEMSIQISYPGLRGQACGIELRSSRYYGSSAGLTPLADALEVVNSFNLEHAPVLTAQRYGQNVRYYLDPHQRDTYVTRVRLRTKTGESLAGLIQRVVPKTWPGEPDVRVIVQQIKCPKP